MARRSLLLSLQCSSSVRSCHFSSYSDEWFRDSLSQYILHKRAEARALILVSIITFRRKKICIRWQIPAGKTESHGNCIVTGSDGVEVGIMNESG